MRIRIWFSEKDYTTCNLESVIWINSRDNIGEIMRMNPGYFLINKEHVQMVCEAKEADDD